MRGPRSPGSACFPPLLAMARAAIGSFPLSCACFQLFPGSLPLSSRIFSSHSSKTMNTHRMSSSPAGNLIHP
jgi:hypothetical protein